MNDSISEYPCIVKQDLIDSIARFIPPGKTLQDLIVAVAPCCSVVERQELKTSYLRRNINYGYQRINSFFLYLWPGQMGPDGLMSESRVCTKFISDRLVEWADVNEDWWTPLVTDANIAAFKRMERISYPWCSQDARQALMSSVFVNPLVAMQAGLLQVVRLVMRKEAALENLNQTVWNDVPICNRGRLYSIIGKAAEEGIDSSVLPELLEIPGVQLSCSVIGNALESRNVPSSRFQMLLNHGSYHVDATFYLTGLESGNMFEYTALHHALILLHETHPYRDLLLSDSPRIALPDDPRVLLLKGSCIERCIEANVLIDKVEALLDAGAKSYIRNDLAIGMYGGTSALNFAKDWWGEGYIYDRMLGVLE
mmetsp:Transcript_29227/g.63428  ORF Transcript_29227/g.63428 Transcript_29227/m.63428 type:complete len:368 (-) Transcript_29227:67-1170(-)